MLIVKSEGVMCGDTDDEECDKVKLLIYSAMWRWALVTTDR